MFETTKDFVKDLWGFVQQRQNYLLVPVIVTLLLVSALIAFAQSSAIAPFIYTLF
ncbi:MULTISPECIES: DUF5989 family protein [Sphaerospermopsis]|jgi:hypothetical protein|uniref:SxtK n=1 Tax=Sphaerospermopsis torques-reginae ITEP-024 TaxID=984208 RepID=A0ABX8WW03_9CYAN|nr:MULTISPECIES: DUF5989 family protein [Sphaerospermopsis]MBE9056842.1 hypothetical protein [Sphaerospermopsis sp. LEGE 08334]QYX30562.1 hypothetical protein K2F26_16920 [Sphaerospermopsis torques-reginae ITEP-024]